MTLIAPTAPAVADDDLDLTEDLDLALARARAGDRAAFALLRERLTPRVLTLLQSMVGDRERCEELLDEVFDEVWTRAQEGSAPEFSAEPWVLALAHRHASELAA